VPSRPGAIGRPPGNAATDTNKPLKLRAYAIHVNRRLLLTVARAQQPKAIWHANVPLQTDERRFPDRDTKVVPMLRLTTLRLTYDGRLLGFDTGDWSMLLGGFVLAGLLALLV
jgi:hypothetical protein